MFSFFFRELLSLAIRKLSSEFYRHHHELFIPHEMPVSHFELVSLLFSLLTFWGFIEVSVVAYTRLEDATPRHLYSRVRSCCPHENHDFSVHCIYLSLKRNPNINISM